MTDAYSNYWSMAGRRVSRRRVLTSAGTVGAGLAGAALIGCGGDEESGGGGADTGGIDRAGTVTAAPVGSPTAASGEPRSGGTMIMAMHSEPPTIDPMGNLSALSKSIGAAVYSRMLAYETGPGHPVINFNTVPDAAESMETADALTYTLKINPAVRYTAPIDRPMTSEDVTFSYGRLTGQVEGVPQGPDAAVMSQFVDHIETPDDSTVVYHLKEPYGAFPQVLADGRAAQIMPIEAGDVFDPSQEHIGSGPWLFGQYESGSRTTFTRNPDWHLGPDRPYMDGAEYVIITEPATQLSQFLGGNLDQIPDLTPDGIRRVLDAIENVQVLETPAANTLLMVFAEPDLSSGPMSDARVRRAMSMAINRDEILEAAAGFGDLNEMGLDVAYEWATFVPHTHKGYWLDPKTQGSPEYQAAFAYNPAEARKLLDAAGVESFSSEWHYNSGYTDQYQITNELVPQFLSEIGINFETVIDDYSSVFIPRTFVGDFSGVASIYYTLGETGNFMTAPFLPGLPRNVSGINDSQLNEMVAEYMATFDVEERQQQMHAMQEYAAETMYYIPLPRPSAFQAFQPHIGNAADYRTHGHASSIDTVSWWWKNV